MGLIFCALASAYKAVHDAGLTPEERIPKKVREYELELAAYELNSSAYSREIQNNSERSEHQQEYMEKSVLMRIDPYRVPIAAADIFIRLDDAEWEGLPDNLGTDPTDSIIKVYTSNFSSSLDWGPIEELTGSEKIYLEEILSISADYSSNTFSIRVVYSDGETAQQILGILLDQILGRQEGLAASVGRHTLTVSSQTLTYVIDRSLAESQRSNLAAITDYERSIIELRTDLEELKEDEPKKPFVIGFVQYPIIGLVLGMLLMSAIYVSMYLLDGRIHGEKDIQNRFGYRLIGSFQPPKKTIAKKKQNRCSILCKEEDIYKRISLNIMHLAGKHKNILITGTVKTEKLQLISKAVMKQSEGITLTVAENINLHPDALKALAECEAVLLVEERDKSFLSEIRKTNENIITLNKPVIGYVLL